MKRYLFKSPTRNPTKATKFPYTILAQEALDNVVEAYAIDRKHLKSLWPLSTDIIGTKVDSFDITLHPLTITYS